MELTLTKLPWYAQVGAFVALGRRRLRRLLLLLRDAGARRHGVARRRSCSALRADITKGLTTAKKLPEFRAQVTDLEGRLANLKAVLPEEKDAADLLRRMQTVAAQSNLTIKGFKPAPTVTKQLHAEWPITLELDGTYHNLAIFFDRVGKFTRIVNISGLDVKGSDKPERERDDHRHLRRDDVRAARQAGAAKPGRAPRRRAAAGEGQLMARATVLAADRARSRACCAARPRAGARRRSRRRASRQPPPAAPTPAGRAGAGAAAAGSLHLPRRRAARSVPQPPRRRHRSARSTSRTRRRAGGADGRRDLRARHHAEPRRARRDGAGARQQDLHRAPGRQARSTARSRAITPQGLVVVQEVNDPLSLVKQREVRKLLRSLEDAKE